MEVKRGEIYTVDLIEKTTKGFEIGKKRPAIIIQADPWNEELPTTIIIPLSSAHPRYAGPGTVTILSGEAGLKENSKVIFPQLRSIDKSRLDKRLGVVPKNKMEEVDKMIAFVLGLETIS